MRPSHFAPIPPKRPKFPKTYNFLAKTEKKYRGKKLDPRENLPKYRYNRPRPLFFYHRNIVIFPINLQSIFMRFLVKAVFVLKNFRSGATKKYIKNENVYFLI